MILTCPNCGTQYVVKDGAIPPQGRQVRCAACKHSWHQDPEPSLAEPEVETEPQPRAAEQETLAEATMIEPRSGPEAEERAYEGAELESGQPEAPPPEPEPEPSYVGDERASESAALAAEQHAAEVSADLNEAAVEPSAALAADWNQPPRPETTDDEFSPFPAADEVAPRRRSRFVVILIIVIIVTAAAAAFYFYAPQQWKARVGLGMGTTSELALVTTHMDRQQLESGNELLTVTGRVINPTSAEQAVPPLQAQLKTHGGKVVYSWTIAPPARSLAPGASASFNSAEVNVPPGGDELTITLGESKV